MRHWQWGWIMFGLVMVCYYLTGKQETSLLLPAFGFLFMGTMLSIAELPKNWTWPNKEKK